ncbi:MAG: FkbM family methyltransferase [Thermoanaerobaculia bacterium]
MRRATDVPRQVLARTADGRRLLTPLADVWGQFVYFLGEYEPGVTEVVRRVVEPGDVCVDVGANIGWYTTLLQTLVAPGGAVHAFEPLPRSFETLRRNVELNESSAAVRLNAVAVGEAEGQADLHVFADLPDSHASVSSLGRSDSISSPVRVTSLDSYLERWGVGEVSFVKMDVEGSELAVLEGAGRLFDQTRPPIVEIEMALATSRHFDHLPNDLIAFMRGRADFEFYSIDEERAVLRPIDGFRDDEVGANVLCVPRGAYRDRLARLRVLRPDRRREK